MSREKLPVSDLGSLSKGEFVARFGPVYERSPWVAEAVYADGPYRGLDDLHAAMARAVDAASGEKKMDLIRAHPDLAGRAAMAGELTPESAGEQSSAGLDRLSPQEYEEFAKTNRRYRERFGMPFIVCVREHTKRSILENVAARLNNGNAEEVEVALGEVHKISRLRLQDLIEDERG